MADSYDVIVIGSGAGGGTLVHRLAPSGKRILLLERGDWLPREPQNWLAQDVFVDNRYVSPDTWYDADGKPFQPQVHYFVGGSTKLYGAALHRLRKEDFGERRHRDGVPPAWPKQQLYDKLKSMLGHLGVHSEHLVSKHAYMKNEIPVAGCAHQAGTCRFGAVNPALTAMANALRVGDRPLERMGALPIQRETAGAL